MRKTSSIRCAATVVFALVLGAQPQLGRAFPPERGIRDKDNAGGIAQLVGTPHTTMTRDALAVVLSRELGTATQSAENVRAVSAIALANMNVDSNQEYAQLHADGETFFLAHRRLHELREMVLAALRVED